VPVPVNLDTDLLTDSSTIAHKSSDIVINDQDIDDYSGEGTKMKCLTFCVNKFEDTFLPPSTSPVSIIMSSTTDGDSVGNVSLATIEVYELHKDIKFNHHGPKVVPKNETPETICTVNTIGAIHSRCLFCIPLDQVPPAIA
jgi:hypothetical protein